MAGAPPRLRMETVMRWLGGFVGATPCSRSPRPAGARLLWDGPFPLWVVGQWPDHEARDIDRGGARAAVIGPCGSTDIAFAADASADTVTARPGAYTVIRTDHQQLTVFTDLGGTCPLYTTTFDGGIVWGSSARALAELTGAGVDVIWLANALADPAAPASGSRSPFTGVCAAPPGARITLRPGRSPVTAPLRLIRSDTVAEATQRLRHALEGGVTTRVTAANTPTCDLSGGLDSTSLCFLACEHLPSTKTVTAVTVLVDGQSDGGGDLGYAQAAVRHASGRIVHRLLPLTNEHLPYSGLDRVPATDEPAPSIVTYSRLAAEFALLAELGSDCHLTGDGGDNLLHPQGYLADLARSGRWLRLAGHALGWARLQRCSPWTLLAASLSRARAGAAADWLTPQAIELATPDDGRSGPARRDANTRPLREVQTVGRTARADAQLAEAFGLTIHNPYTDSSVIAAALSVPPWRRGDPWRYKPLLTMAVGDLLPPAIASRTTKGSFDADHYRGLRANLPTVLDLTDGRLTELGLIDARRLRAALRRAACPRRSGSSSRPSPSRSGFGPSAVRHRAGGRRRLPWQRETADERPGCGRHARRDRCGHRLPAPRASHPDGTGASPCRRRAKQLEPTSGIAPRGQGGPRPGELGNRRDPGLPGTDPCHPGAVAAVRAARGAGHPGGTPPWPEGARLRPGDRPRLGRHPSRPGRDGSRRRVRAAGRPASGALHPRQGGMLRGVGQRGRRPGPQWPSRRLETRDRQRPGADARLDRGGRTTRRRTTVD